MPRYLPLAFLLLLFAGCAEPFIVFSGDALTGTLTPPPADTKASPSADSKPACDGPNTDPWVKELRDSVLDFDELVAFAVGAYGAPLQCEGEVNAEFDGMKFGFGADPLRTLLILAVILGGSFAVVQVSIPRVAEDDFGQTASAAGIVLGVGAVDHLA